MLVRGRLGPKPSGLTACEIYPLPDHRAGAGLSGAPCTDTGPTGGGSGEDFLRAVPTTRARAIGCGIAEVVTGSAAFCSDSTRAVNDENRSRIRLRSVC